MKKVILLLVISLIFLNTGCSGRKEETKNTALSIYVSILPQAFLLEKIGGDFIEVSVMVPPGKSPATYDPTPQQVVGLGRADLFFTLGVPFEKTFLPAIQDNMTSLPMVDSSQGIKRRMLKEHHHDHEDDVHSDEEGSEDPHIWLSPVLAITIAENMTRSLIEIDPYHKKEYTQNLATLVANLEDLDKEISTLLEPVQGETLFVFHPSFGYFSDRYGLVQEAIELGGKEPSPADLERIILLAREEGVRIILVQPEFSQSSAKAVAKAIDGLVIPVETLNGDYINNLRNLAQQIRKGLE